MKRLSVLLLILSVCCLLGCMILAVENARIRRMHIRDRLSVWRSGYEWGRLDEILDNETPQRPYNMRYPPGGAPGTEDAYERWEQWRLTAWTE